MPTRNTLKQHRPKNQLKRIRTTPLTWNSGLKMRRMKDPQFTNAFASAPLYTQNFFSFWLYLLPFHLYSKLDLAKIKSISPLTRFEPVTLHPYG